MMGKKIALALAFAAIISMPVHADVSISAESAIVVEPESGMVVYEKNADEQMLIASTTKIMTALVVLENCGLQEHVTVTAEHAATEGSSMYLRPGEDYTVEQLLYGLLLASGNDAAAALADHVSGSMADFAALMNDRAQGLGLENTHFANSHGLDAEGHYSSARDLAVITAAAMENETFCKIFSTGSYTVGENTYYNHNKLLSRCPGCIGGKTGYTEAAGRVLVSVCERDGLRFVCVTISDPDDWNDHIALYARAFDRWRRVKILQENAALPVNGGETEWVSLSVEAPELILPRDEYIVLRTYLPDYVKAPVSVGERLGYVTVTVGENTEEYGIFAGETVAAEKAESPGAIQRFKRLFGRGFGIYYDNNS